MSQPRVLYVTNPFHVANGREYAGEDEYLAGGLEEPRLATGQPVYNELRGKGDMVGKQYLLDLHAAGFPVVPTVSSVEEIDALPRADRYSSSRCAAPTRQGSSSARPTRSEQRRPRRHSCSRWSSPTCRPRRTSASTGGSSGGTTSSTACSGSTPAVRRTASCCFSSSRT